MDEDGDGYGTVAASVVLGAKATLKSEAATVTTVPLPFPAAIDLVGDGIDGSCNGAETCYRDTDNDGFGPADTTDYIGSPFNIDCSEFGEAYGFQEIDCDDVNPDSPQ